MKIIQTISIPSKAIATLSFKDSVEKPVSEVFEWFRDNIRGTVWWSKTQFYDPLTGNGRRHYSSRQKHFKDGYWVYYFYFALKTDAAKFILFRGTNGK